MKKTMRWPFVTVALVAAVGTSLFVTSSPAHDDGRGSLQYKWRNVRNDAIVDVSDRVGHSGLEERRRNTLPPSKRSAGGLPTIDLRKTCRVSVDLSGAAPEQRSNDACIKSEQVARDQIVKQWGEFLPAEKASCIRPNAYLPSYVEWLTCLELRRDVRKLGAPNRYS